MKTHKFIVEFEITDEELLDLNFIKQIVKEGADQCLVNVHDISVFDGDAYFVEQYHN